MLPILLHLYPECGKHQKPPTIFANLPTFTRTLNPVSFLGQGNCVIIRKETLTFAQTSLVKTTQVTRLDLFIIQMKVGRSSPSSKSSTSISSPRKDSNLHLLWEDLRRFSYLFHNLCTHSYIMHLQYHRDICLYIS